MKRFSMFALLIVLVGSSYGCAATMAAKQPGEKDLSIFTPGTPRALVLAEYGKPVTTENNEGKKTDIYKFTNGYGTGTKVLRIMFHVAADVFTLFLWEFIGMPIEAGFDGTEMAYQVKYDREEKITTAELLKGKKPDATTDVAGDCDPGIDSC
jgi:hypothetical protein